MACGSGASATAYASYIKGFTNKKTNIHFAIGNLMIEIDDQENIIMNGGYNYVYKGEINILCYI